MNSINSSISTELRLCRIDDVEDGEGLRVEVQGRPPFAVFHVDGEFFVTDDTCTHAVASLAEGFVENGQVECPWHSGRFCLKTGSALTFPVTEAIRTYKPIIRDGEIFVLVEDEEK